MRWGRSPASSTGSRPTPSTGWLVGPYQLLWLIGPGKSSSSGGAGAKNCRRVAPTRVPPILRQTHLHPPTTTRSQDTVGSSGGRPQLSNRKKRTLKTCHWGHTVLIPGEHKLRFPHRGPHPGVPAKSAKGQLYLSSRRRKSPPGPSRGAPAPHHRARATGGMRFRTKPVPAHPLPAMELYPGRLHRPYPPSSRAPPRAAVKPTTPPLRGRPEVPPLP